MRIVSADYSQIELRVLAHLSKDPVLVDAFRTRAGRAHAHRDGGLRRRGESGVTDEMRRRAKTINFGVIYGMGEVALAKRLEHPARRGGGVHRGVLRALRGRAALHGRDARTAAQKGEAVRTLFGRRRLLPDLRSSNGMLRAAAERIAQNTPIQGTAADLLKLAMIELAEPVVPGARMVLTVHDELVFEVPEARVAEATKRRQGRDGAVVPARVPLVVDVGSGANWGDLE